MSETNEAPTAPQQPPLAATLLHAPLSRDDKPGRLFAYPWWWAIVVSVAIAYHALVLLVHNLPNKSLTGRLHTVVNKYTNAPKYVRATGIGQSWGMFAPNPHRSNVFLRVFVEDADGEVWDMNQDIYGEWRFPYLWYDRLGKINRRLTESQGYVPHYAAWVCREWERTHGGELPKRVRFVKLWTQIPAPEKVYPFGWYDPLRLQLHEVQHGTHECEKLVHGRTPNHIRERIGLDPIADDEFRGVSLRTWWDRANPGKRDTEDRGR